MVRWDDRKDLMILIILLQMLSPQVKDEQIRKMLSRWPKDAGDPPSVGAIASRLTRLRQRAFKSSPDGASYPSSTAATPRSSPTKKIGSSSALNWNDVEDDDEDGFDDGFPSSPVKSPNVPRVKEEPLDADVISIKRETKPEPLSDSDNDCFDDDKADSDDGNFFSPSLNRLLCVNSSGSVLVPQTIGETLKKGKQTDWSFQLGDWP